MTATAAARSVESGMDIEITLAPAVIGLTTGDFTVTEMDAAGHGVYGYDFHC